MILIKKAVLFITTLVTSIGHVNAHIELESNGDLGSKLRRKASIAMQLSQGIYYGTDFDPTKQDDIYNGNTHNYQVYGDDAVVYWQKKTCFVAFAGLATSDSDTGIDFVDGFLDTVVDGLLSDPILQATKDSGFTRIERKHTSQYGCSFNTYLIQDWIDNHRDGDSGLFEGIDECMQSCKNKDSDEDEDSCEVIYTGHSQGGVEAMATAYYLEDQWYHKTNPPTIITFGQPGTFKNGDCIPLQKWKNYMYRFVNLVGWSIAPFWPWESREYYSTYDIAPAHGGKHMGYTILLTNDSTHVKKYDPDDEDAYVGPQVSSLDVFTDTTDEHRAKAHLNSLYKDRITALDSSNNDATSNGFSEGKYCDKDEQCESSDCGGTYKKCNP